MSETPSQALRETLPETRPAPRVAAPVAEAERMHAIDALRGFAPLGILIVNIRSFARVGAAYGSRSTSRGASEVPGSPLQPHRLRRCLSGLRGDDHAAGPERASGSRPGASGGGRPHGVHELHRPERAVYAHLPRPRAGSVRARRKRGMYRHRRGGLDAPVGVVAVVARPAPLRTPGVALAYSFLRTATTDENRVSRTAMNVATSVAMNAALNREIR